MLEAQLLRDSIVKGSNVGVSTVTRLNRHVTLYPFLDILDKAKNSLKTEYLVVYDRVKYDRNIVAVKLTNYNKKRPSLTRCL